MYQEMRASVIIPVFNDRYVLKGTLGALLSQSTSGDYEIIVVDNGSLDGSADIARSFPSVKVLIEDTHLGSPYSCRNRGIEAASGEVLVFLDSTCRPSKDWLEKGLAQLERDVDLVAGNVQFDFDDDMNPAKIYDSLIHVQMHQAVEKGKAMTANLFVRKKVFEALGVFPEGIRSGGDMRWTKQATSAGYRLVFAKEAIVYKKARSYFSLLGKQWRINKAHPARWQAEIQQRPLHWYLISFFRPMRPRSIRKFIRERGSPPMISWMWRVWFFALLMHIVGAAAHFYGYLLVRLGESQDY